MKLTIITAIVFLITTSSISWANDTSNKITWSVASKEAKCFFENLKEYKRSEDEPIVIFLKACPTVGRKAALAQLQVNTAVQPSVTETSKNLDDIIVYNRNELDCLSQLDLSLSAPIVKIPRRPCELLR